MKTNLLAGYRFTKVLPMPFLLLLMSTWAFAQNKTYATSQSNQISGICLGCSVENPQNAVGNNEGDYSSFKIGIGVIGKIDQTLIFPEPTTKKIIVGIGTANIPLSVSLLQGVTVETFNGDTSNNDLQTISNSILKLGSQANKASLELNPTKKYDRIKISLNGGLINLGEELRIYYAYTSSPLPPMCNPLTQEPLPIHYYSFNGNTKDAISNFNLLADILSEVTPSEYENNMVCNQGLKPIPRGLGTDIKRIPLKDPRTVSFWARVGTTSNQSSAFIKMSIYGKVITITPDTITIRSIDDSTPFNPYPYFGKGKFLKTYNNYSRLNLYTLVFNGAPDTVPPGIPAGMEEEFYKDRYSDQLCLYINGVPAYNVIDSGGLGFPDRVYCTHWGPQYSNKEGGIGISFSEAQMDELLIYDKVFNSMEVFNFMTKYITPPPPPTSSEMNDMKLTFTEKILTVSPNPTIGQITLDGNILLLDSEISIRNTSGAEVYHSKFRSKTFDLPSNLPGGVYILSVQTKDNKVYTRKIILTR